MGLFCDLKNTVRHSMDWLGQRDVGKYVVTEWVCEKCGEYQNEVYDTVKRITKWRVQK